MKVTGLDGRQYSLNTALYSKTSTKCSEHHRKARLLLKDIFGLSSILEEVNLPGTSNLRADFFIPDCKIIVEVHGQQHYGYVQHFHKNKTGFHASKKRDNRKLEWCELNNITLIELNSLESEDEWRTKLCS